MKKIRLGCPNSDCLNNKKNVKFKKDISNCPKCDTPLVHVCKSKKCRTVVDRDNEVYCVLCKADHEDKKAVAAKGATVGGAGLAGVVVKYRHVIKEAVVTLIKR